MEEGGAARAWVAWEGGRRRERERERERGRRRRRRGERDRKEQSLFF
jgi:hypothetical protein